MDLTAWPAVWPIDGTTFIRGDDRAAGLARLVPLHRAAMHADVARVVGWDDAAQHRRLAAALDAGVLYLASDLRGDAVASFVLAETPEGLALSQLYVRPDVQGQGLGGSVLGAVQAMARARGVPVTLTVLHGSRAASLYRRYGWREVGATRWQMEMRWDAGAASGDPTVAPSPL